MSQCHEEKLEGVSSFCVLSASSCNGLTVSQAAFSGMVAPQFQCFANVCMLIICCTPLCEQEVAMQLLPARDGELYQYLRVLKAERGVSSMLSATNRHAISQTWLLLLCCVGDQVLKLGRCLQCKTIQSRHVESCPSAAMTQCIALSSRHLFCRSPYWNSLRCCS